MRSALLAALLILLTVSAEARTRSSYGSTSSRSCHCDRYTDPHYSGYVPRTAPYSGGRATRY